MVSGSSKDDSDLEEDKRDFEILRRQLIRSASSTSSSSSTSSNYRQSSPIDSETSNEIWPLRLNTTFIDHYLIGDVIGSGSYAEVRECINTLTLERSAIKIVNKDYLKRQAPNALNNQLQEIKLLRKFDHPNIICIRDCLFKESRLFLVLEHCTFNLHDLLVDQTTSTSSKLDNDDYDVGFNKLCPSIARTLFRQLCFGLDYLQSLGVVHRDIKPQNLLINNCGILKIIDFGVSHILSLWSKPDSCSNYEGSPLFQAPEVVSGQGHYDGFKVDIWSTGVTLHLMIYGRYPFMDTSLLNLYDKILTQDFRPPKLENGRTNVVLNNLLSKMLDKLSSRRATIAQVLDHPWLSLNQSQCDLDIDGEQSDLNELLFALTHQAPLVSTMHQSQNNVHSNQRDIYRSMSVLPYLYNHHFPNAPIIKAQNRDNAQNRLAFTGTILSKTYGHRDSDQVTLSGSSTSNASKTSDGSGTSGPPATFTNAASKSEGSSTDPHRVLSDEDDPIEWGTEAQYRLLKVPQIRANRIGFRRRSGRLRRRKPISVQNGRVDDSGQKQDADYNSLGSDSSDE